MLYITYNITIEPMTEQGKISDLIKNPSANVFMLGPYNQVVPLVIASVAVGTSVVNRTPVKLVGHLVGALIVGLIAALASNRLVTAFLGYTIGYVYTCFKNGIPDVFTITGITMSFAVLLGLNMATSAMLSGLGSVYFFTMLASVLAGFGGVYTTEAIFGSRGVYDFKGCSCDDCATTNQCLTQDGNSTQGAKSKILARRIS